MAPSASPESSSAWPSAFRAENEFGAAATACFGTASFWRDLVAFSWNLHTVEGREGVASLLEANLDRTDPTGFALEEPATEDGGVITAWFVFETGVGRGRGLVRLREEDGPRAEGAAGA